MPRIRIRKLATARMSNQINSAIKFRASGWYVVISMEP